MFELATRKSPIEMNTIIRREVVRKSGHIKNVKMMVKDPRMDSEAAAVDSPSFKGSSAIRYGPVTVVGTSEEFS